MEVNARRATRPWPEVLGELAGRVDAGEETLLPLLAVARHLATSRYARSLHACVIDDALLLGRSAAFEAGRDELRIRFDAAAAQFVFAHSPQPGSSPWSRECGRDEWQATLERLFHKRLTWFHEG